MEQLSFDDLEAWKPIPGYEDKYQVSDHGHVYALPRHGRDGRRLPGQFLKCQLTRQGYHRVGLVGSDGKQVKYGVHRLVLWAFTGENPPELDTRHLDGNPANNRWAPGRTEEEARAAGGNLFYGTRSENAYDRVRHGTWVNNNRFVGVTKCINDHDFDEANTYWRPTGGRACKACARERRALYRATAREVA